ncbi:sulfurtransferase TusA family protein [Arboricoccus pini]|nr:sulfurtransferase TusA family protein [Arboricoccus pini]
MSAFLDITDETCPMTFVRTKLRLEAMQPGQVLHVRLRDGEAAINVPRAVADHGHRIMSMERLEAEILELVIERK